MKQVHLTFLAVLLFALGAIAQQPANKDTKAATTGTTQQQPAAQPAAPQGKPLPQAKSQEEYKAFNDAMTIISKGDPAEAEAAADAFSAKFKTSEITPILYHRVMQLFQNANNPDKAIEVGNKILAISPNDPVANVLVASLISERVRDTDIDMQQKTDEAEKDAKRSLQTVDTDFLVNPGTPQAQVDASRNMIRSMAYAALANCEAVKGNNPAAENYFKQSFSMPDAQVDAVTMLRYALLLDKEKKYSEAMVIANKALDAAPAGSQVQQLVKDERQRLIMLNSGGTPPATPQAQNPAATPAGATTAPKQ